MSETSPGSAGPPRYSNLQLRIMSGVVMAAVTLAVTWVGGVWFTLFAVIVGGASLYEWLRITGFAPAAMPGIAIIAAVVAGLIMVLAGVNPFLIVALAVGAAAALAVFYASQDAPRWIVAGAVWHPLLPAAALANLRGDTNAGLAAVLFVFSVVWATDIAAYFTGRAIGGPKLAPAISPGKTWSGALGGAFAGIVCGTAVAWAAGAERLGLIVVIAAAMSVASQFGDLFESALKRRYAVKDSSNLIPGHGGVLDRVDGLVIAAVALWLIAWAASGSAQPASWLFPA